MKTATIFSRASNGVDAPQVTVEVHLAGGFPGFTIVGLPATAVKESRDRVKSAIINSGFKFPTARIVVNLAPADLPKQGGRFDLAMAIGILAANENITLAHLDQYEFAAELSLMGDLREIKGVLPFSIATQKQQRQLITAPGNADEATLSRAAKVLPAKHLLDVVAHLNEQTPLTLYENKIRPQQINYPFDLVEVKGQPYAKRVLEIAASGNHSLLLQGPPGSGKSMLAERLPTILPPMPESDALATAAVKSLTHEGFNPKDWRQRPFRRPHHTSSSVALVGGGNPPKPGEISIAHCGILFLDELPQFSRHVLETLREPLESKVIHISRAQSHVAFPADFQLIAAMNPCPCGYATDPSGRCHCTQEQIARYQGKLSGPFLDRIDLHVEVAPLAKKFLLRHDTQTESSATVRARVEQTHQRQLARQNCLNSYLSGQALREFCPLATEQLHYLEETFEQLGLSARSFDRVLRVARTIADMAGHERIATEHLMEAIGYRRNYKM